MSTELSKENKEQLMKRMVQMIIETMVGHPEEININVLCGRRNMIIEIDVHSEDYGFVVGRQGQNIQALRCLLRASIMGRGHELSVEVMDRRSQEEIKRIKKDRNNGQSLQQQNGEDNFSSESEDERHSRPTYSPAKDSRPSKPSFHKPRSY